MTMPFGNATGSFNPQATGSMLRGGSKQRNAPPGMNAFTQQNFSPEQMQQFQQLFQYLGPDSFLSQLAGGSQEGFEQMEAPAHRQFQEKIGGLASRFSQGGGGPGAMSGRRSSAFGNANTQAASDFAQDLQSNRMGIQRQSLQDLFGLSDMLLKQQPTSTIFTPKPQKNNWMDFIKEIISGGAGAAGKFFGA